MLADTMSVGLIHYLALAAPLLAIALGLFLALTGRRS